MNISLFLSKLFNRFATFIRIKSFTLRFFKLLAPKDNPIQDPDKDKKFLKLIDETQSFGEIDFSYLCLGLFSSSLQNHGFIHQRIDEASFLWSMVKRTKGKILEVGRAAGGSTTLILGASGTRKVVSIDRDPRHLSIAKHFFERKDIKDRLKLYNQSSRKPIKNDKYGFLFIDGDHSYEGVCYDIATFWNQLVIDSIIVFHDAQSNPISYVPQVKKAVDELIENKSAVIISSWGSQLAVKKLKNIEQKAWYKKIDENFWKKNNSTLQNGLANPDINSFQINDNQKINFHNNLIGYENFEEDAWIKNNLEISLLNFTADNSVRFVRPVNSNPSILSKNIKKLIGRFTIEICLRPKNIDKFDLILDDYSDSYIFKIDHVFKNNHPLVNFISNQKIIEVEDIKVEYLNAYYHFYYLFNLNEELSSKEIKLILGKNDQFKDSGIYLNNFSFDQE